MALAVGLANLVVLAAILLLVVLTIAIVLRMVRQKMTAAQNWPSTKGVVLVSEVKDAGGDSGWYTKVLYRYEVGGQAYESSRITVGVELGQQSLEAHERLSARFPAGAEVTVYYNPQNPAEAALIRGDPNSWNPSSF
jgi:hypothetical protein